MSEHWTLAHTPVRRILLWVAEMLSFVVSKNVATGSGQFKLPLTSHPPLGPSRSGPSTLAIIAMLLPLASCGPTWAQTVERSAARTHEAVQAAWGAARPVLHARCLAAAVECGEAGKTREACPDWARCHETRAAIAAAVLAAESLSAAAIDAVAAGDRQRAETIVAELVRSGMVAAEMARQATGGGK
ncbi:MAG: hypothetical protein IPG96_16170 [Proteobacteria bacterium]|nr:hypothetical protein [Pseudomonadota bacterium]